jgi:hypothetical protein
VADNTLAGDVVLVIGSGFGGIASSPAAPADGGGATAEAVSPEAACQ